MRIHGLREMEEAYDALRSASYRAQIWDVESRLVTMDLRSAEAMSTFEKGSSTALSIRACRTRWSHALALHRAASTASSALPDVDSALVECGARAAQWRTAQLTLVAMEDQSIRAGGGLRVERIWRSFLDSEASSTA